MIFSGDPALTLPSPQKPDYHVAAEGISAIPANVTTSLDSFRMRINAYNLCKSTTDTVVVKVEHINPKGVVSTVKTYSLRNLYFSDTTTGRVQKRRLKMPWMLSGDSGTRPSANTSFSA